MPRYEVVRDVADARFIPANGGRPVAPPSISYQSADLPLNAEQVDRFARARGQSVKAILVPVWGVLACLAWFIHRWQPDLDGGMILVTAFFLGILSLFLPWLAEWHRREEGWRLVQTRYTQTTETVFAPAAPDGIAVKTTPSALRADGEELAEAEHENLMIMLRFLLKRCYYKTTAMPRPEDKPYDIIPLVNKQLTPKRFSVLMAVLEELELVTRAKAREKREVILPTYEEARLKLDKSAGRVKVINFGNINRRAEEIAV